MPNDIKYQLSDTGVLISYYGVNPGSEADFYDTQIKAFLTNYKSPTKSSGETSSSDQGLLSTLKSYYLAKGNTLYDTIPKIKKEMQSLYTPATYCVFGEYDLATILLVDDYDILNRLSLFDKCRNQQFIYGSLLTNSERLKLLFENNSINTKDNPFYHTYLIGMAQLKFNPLFDIQYGTDLFNIITNIMNVHIGYKVKSKSFENQTKAYFIDTLGWNEITVLIFANDYTDIMQLYADYRKLTLDEIIKKGLLNYNADILNNIKSKIGTNDLNLHLFSSSKITLGFHYDIFDKIILNNDARLPELDECYVKPIIYLSSKPGHTAELTETLPPHYNKNTTNIKAKKLMYNGTYNAIRNYPCEYFTESFVNNQEPRCLYSLEYEANCLLNGNCATINRYGNGNNPALIPFKYFLKDLYTIRNDANINRHLYDSKTNLGIEVDFELKDISHDHTSISNKITEHTGYDTADINNLKDTLRKIQIPKYLITLFTHTFSMFNVRIRDYQSMDTFLELYPYLNGLHEFVVGYNKALDNLTITNRTLKQIIYYFQRHLDDIKSPQVKDSIDYYRKWIDTQIMLPRNIEKFNQSFTQRFYSGLYMHDLTDISIYYKGGAQQILSCINGFYNLIRDSFITDINKGSLVVITSDPEIHIEEINGQVINVNSYYLYHPEMWVNLFHEIGHHIILHDKEPQYKDILELIKFVKHECGVYENKMNSDGPLNRKGNESKMALLLCLHRSLEEMLGDLFLLIFGFLNDYEMYFKHYWGCFLSLPRSESDIKLGYFRFFFIYEMLLSEKECNEFKNRWIHVFKNNPWINNNIIPEERTIESYANEISSNYETLKNKLKLHGILNVTVLNERYGLKNADYLTLTSKLLKNMYHGLMYTKKQLNINKDTIAKYQGLLKKGIAINIDKPFNKNAIELNYAYLANIYEMIQSDSIFLLRDVDGNLPHFSLESSPYMFDSFGLIFISDIGYRKEYFRNRMTFIRSLWGIASKQKADLLLSLIR